MPNFTQPEFDKLTQDDLLKNVFVLDSNGKVCMRVLMIGQNIINWGQVGGTLSNQTDLQAALNALSASDTNLQNTKINLSEKGAANGVVPLGADSKISTAYLPSIVFNDIKAVATIAARDLIATTDRQGLIVKVADRGDGKPANYMWDLETLAWIQFADVNDVLMVNGQTGTVVLNTSHISELTNLYFTEARVIATTLTGFAVGTNATIVATDSILVAMNKIQAQINAKEPTIATGTALQFWRGDKSWTDFATTVRVSILTGLSLASAAAVSATDNFLVAIGKLQKQCSDLSSSKLDIIGGLRTGMGALLQKIEIDATGAEVKRAVAAGTSFLGIDLIPTIDPSTRSVKEVPFSYLAGFKGDGSDGNVTIASNTTLVRDMYYNDLTINATFTLDPNGFVIYCKGTLTNNGKIARNGNNASGTTGGTALNTGNCGTCLGGSNGGPGGTSGTNLPGTNGVATDPSYATTGTASAAGGAGGLSFGGAGTGGGPLGGTSATATQGNLYNVYYNLAKLLSNLATPSRYTVYTRYLGLPSSGGGGSGNGNSSGINGGPGGGAGGNGGNIFIFANVIAGTGTIETKGGNAANGQAGNLPGSGSAGGGGGGGGNGGIVFLAYLSGSVWTITMTGGVAGTGNGAGLNGATGTTGQSIIINA